MRVLEGVFLAVTLGVLVAVQLAVMEEEGVRVALRLAVGEAEMLEL